MDIVPGMTMDITSQKGEGRCTHRVYQDMCMFRSARYEQIKAAGLTAPEAGVVRKIVGLP